MSKLISKCKGYQYGLMIVKDEPSNNITQEIHEVTEDDIVNFQHISGLTLKQLRDIYKYRHLIFIMYDSIPVIKKKKEWLPSAESPDYKTYSYNRIIIHFTCPIELNNNEKIDNVIAQKLIECYENGLLESNNEDRFFSFIDEYFDKIEEEDNKTEKDDYNYLFGLYINPDITHEESYLCGFRQTSIPIMKYVDLNIIKGRTIGEICSYPNHFIKDNYMYFLMLDSIPSIIKDSGYWELEEEYFDPEEGEWIDKKEEGIARYYYEINIEKYKDKLIEEVIRDAIQEELERETIKGSFYNRAHIFLDKYPVKSKEENPKIIKKSN